MPRRLLVLALALALPVPLAVIPLSTAFAQMPRAKARKVVKTDAEWKKLLTRPQYEVTRQKATEPPFSGKYAMTHTRGVFECVCCNAPLFSSATKFDSGTGWPSFWQPIEAKAVENAPDRSSGELRIEVMCNDCGAHLGHVFDDGPPPTGLRYCINSLSLKLIPAAATTTKKGSASKTKKGQPSPPDNANTNTDAPPADAPKDAPAEKGK